MSLLTGERGVRSWFIAGNDYVWPRRTAVTVKRHGIRVAGEVSYEGPRGLLRLHRRHVRQRIYLARAHGVEFDVLTTLPPLPDASSWK
jgi:hypothetical protein